MPFSGNKPVAFSQGRRGEVYVYQGHNNRGQVYSPSLDAWRDVGVNAPTVAPTVTKSGTVLYYVARIDIENEGGGYNRPPAVTITHNGTAPTTVATAVSRIQDGGLRSIDVTGYGKGYSQAPSVTLSDSGAIGSGLSFTANLESGSPSGTPATGIVYWEVESQPPAGSLELFGNVQAYLCTAESTAMAEVTEDGFTCWVADAQGGGGGSGAKVRLELLGMKTTVDTATPCCTQQQVDDITSRSGVGVQAFGSGYSSTAEVSVKIAFTSVSALGTPDCTDANLVCPMIVKGYGRNHPKTPKTLQELSDASRFKSRKITSYTISNGGSMYLRAPTCELLPYTGSAKDGATQVSTTTSSAGVVTAIDPNGELRDQRFLWPPTQGDLLANSGGGKATAVIRAHLRGKYQCYYRYVNDSVPTAEGGPLYSNLSPLTEVDCGDGASHITWTYTAASGRSVELWRTTSNQATTLFRVAKIGGTGAFGSTTDNITDWELVDPNRTGFMAMPILLPNGELNANRFGVPPDDFAVGVMFQDRMWMGVDTTGSSPNVLRFSEADEPESMPDVNEVVLQTNLRSTDFVTALIPYAGALIVAQSRHCHRLTYVAQPLVDLGVYMLAYRGCYNQRCWDIFDGKIYAMDDQGVYSMDAQGNVEDLSLGIFDYWVNKIDASLRQWFYVRADKRLGVLRAGVAVLGDGSTKYPSRQLVYSFDFKTWWEERYPAELSSATEVRTDDGGVRLVFGTSGGYLRQLNQGLTDLAESSIATVTITNPGRGYRQPPTITAGGGHGAQFECALNSDGSITGIVIKSPGTKYTNGSLTISAPPTGGVQATATYTVSSSTRPVHWSFKSGCFEYTTDSQDKRGGEAQNRQCSVTYQPTTSQCILNLQTYYNNSRYPRSNVVRRDRGTGFVHSDEVPAAILDMQATPLQEAESHAVARAVFSGRVLDDMMGSDRHVSVALSGKQDAAGSVSIHNLDIYGVNDKSGG
jgi:hypothetical protein